MGNRMSKTVKLLLEDGTLKGVMSIVDSSWNPGEMYSAPKESVDALLSSEACKRFGVYLLLSDEKVYIGQSMDLAKRVGQHVTQKNWWDRVIILTTADDSLNRADIDYLEYYLIQKAQESNRLDSENKKKGNSPKVDKFRKPELEQYLEEALFLMELIGITVFSGKRHGSSKKEDHKTKGKDTDKSYSDNLFYIIRDNNEDEGRMVSAKLKVENGEYRILKGSRLAITPTPSCPEAIKKQRNQAKEVDSKGVLTKDIVFSSPSGAAQYVLYASANGKTAWKDASGNTLESFLQKK